MNPFHARLIAKHQQEAIEKAKQEVEAKAKAQEEGLKGPVVDLAELAQKLVTRPGFVNRYVHCT